MTDEEILPKSHRSRWRELSEDELLRIEFTAADPEALDNISEEIPIEGEPEVEAGYDMTGRGQKVRCVYCKYPNHYKGIVVRYPSGIRCLVGRDCALTHHGVDFESKLVDFDAGVERQSYVRRRRASLAMRAQVQEEFEQLKAHPAIAHHDALLRKWRRDFSEIAAALANVAQRDEMLHVDRQIRDEAAERERKERLGARFEQERETAKAAGSRWQLFKNVREEIGPIGGRLFFGTGTDVGKRIKEIQEEVQKTFRSLSSRELRTSQIRAGLGKLGDHRDALAHEIERLEALPQAFDPENLARIAKWANERDAEREKREAAFEHRKAGLLTARFIAEGRSITERMHWSDTTASLPDSYRVPKRALVAILNEAISGHYEPHEA